MAWETVVRDDKLGLRLVTVQMTCLLHINENKSATEMIALLTQAHTNLEIEQTKMHCPVWEEGFIFIFFFWFCQFLPLLLMLIFGRMNNEIEELSA